MNKFLRYFLLSALVLQGGCAEFDNLTYDLARKPTGKVAILIDLTDQHAYLYRKGEVVLTADVSTGREGYDTRPENILSLKRISTIAQASTEPTCRTVQS